MHISWILVALPLASLAYFAWAAIWQAPTAYAASCLHSAVASHTDLRTIRWVSPRELQATICKFQDVMFIDLLATSRERPHPVEATHCLFVKPEELCDVLRWAPPSSCAVLYGPANLCRLLILEARNIAGHAPLFVVALEE